MRNRPEQMMVMILSFFLAVLMPSVQATPNNSGDTEACLVLLKRTLLKM
jgi:hypothetical protein